MSVKKCPDCGVLPDQPHEDWCDVARCMNCGFQRISCDCDHNGLSVWEGHWPGDKECEEYGLDLNTLPIYCRWDKELKRWIKKEAAK